MEVTSLEELTDNMDRVVLPDGRTVQLKIEPDPYCTINDYDCYGRIEWTRNNEYGPVRPSDMTGRAQILDRDWRGSYGSALWWEPYSDKDFVPTEEQIRRERSQIRDLVEYGFMQVGVEVLEECPKCQNVHVAVSHWIGGVDSIDEPYIHELVNDALAELGIDETGESRTVGSV